MRSLMMPLFFVSVAVHAETLTWKDCVSEVLTSNSALKAALEKKAAAESSVGGARAGFFPQVSGSLAYSKSSANGGSALPGTAGNEPNDNYAATLSLNQNLFNGLQDQAKVDQAKANLKSADASLEGVKAKVLADLKVAFSTLVFAQSSLQLQEKIEKRRTENLNLIQLRFRSGRENRGSVLLSKAYAEQAGLDRLTAANTTGSARADLARVLGRDSADFELQGDIPLTPLPPAPDFRGLAAEAPDIRQSAADVGVAEAALVTAKSGFFPVLGLSASAGRQDREWFPEKEKWSVGATLTLPLFNGGKDYYSSQNASRNLAAARSTLDNVTRDKVTKLRQAYNSYAEALKRVSVDDGFREAAALRAEIARAKYNNGLMTFEDWDVVENDLIAREKASLQSRRDLYRLESEWLAGQGKVP